MFSTPVWCVCVGVVILPLGSSDSPQMSTVLVTASGLAFSLILFQPYNYHVYMKLNAVLHSTISLLGARHLLSIFFFSSSPLRKCLFLHFLRDVQNRLSQNLEKVQIKGFCRLFGGGISGCFSPSFFTPLSKVISCLAKLADKLNCLCLKPFLCKAWHLRSNVCWQRVWTKRLVYELAGAHRRLLGRWASVEGRVIEGRGWLCWDLEMPHRDSQKWVFLNPNAWTCLK